MDFGDEIITGHFQRAREFMTEMSFEDLWKQMMNLTFISGNVCPYAFLCFLIAEREEARLHHLAAVMMGSSTLSYLEGAIETAIYHIRKAISLEPENTEYSEYLLTFFSHPNHPLSLDEATQIAQTVLAKKPDSITARWILSYLIRRHKSRLPRSCDLIFPRQVGSRKLHGKRCFVFSFRYLLNDESILTIGAHNIDQVRSFHLDGYFLLTFGKQKYGLFPDHGKEKEARKYGLEYVTYWLEVLLESCFKIKDTGYVAMLDFEACNRWIEWIQDGDFIRVSLRDSILKNGFGQFVITSPCVEFTKVFWEDERISIDSLRDELLSKGWQLIQEAEKINPWVSLTDPIIKIKTYLDKLQTWNFHD